MVIKRDIVLSPELSLEWHYIKNIHSSTHPDVRFSNSETWWIDKFGHEWQASIRSRMILNSGCPYCSGRLAIAGETDLLTKFPQVAKIWDYDLNIRGPEFFLPTSHDAVNWKCIEGHSWKRDISHQSRTNYFCNLCINNYTTSTIVGHNDLKTLRPDIFATLHPTKNNLIDINKLTVSAGRSVWWIDDLGHEWKTAVSHRTREGTTCPYCTGKRVLAGFNDLATIRPDVAAEWDYIKNGKLVPTEVTAYSSKPAYWKCKKGHTWKTTINNRAGKDSGCLECVPWHTSKIETALFEAIKSQRFEDTRQGIFLPVRWLKNARANVDIYIPSKNLIIEYDGAYHHKDKYLQDTSKTMALVEAGYNVIRIRERKLAFLKIKNNKVRQIAYTPTGRGSRGVNLPDLIEQLFPKKS